MMDLTFNKDYSFAKDWFSSKSWLLSPCVIYHVNIESVELIPRNFFPVTDLIIYEFYFGFLGILTYHKSLQNSVVSTYSKFLFCLWAYDQTGLWLLPWRMHEAAQQGLLEPLQRWKTAQVDDSCLGDSVAFHLSLFSFQPSMDIVPRARVLRSKSRSCQDYLSPTLQVTQH